MKTTNDAVITKQEYEQLNLFEEKTYLLLSLQETEYNKILNKTKLYEYRTKFPKEKVTAYVYISKTIQKVVAIIELDKPFYGSSHDIAEFACKYDDGDYNEFIDWLHGRRCHASKITGITLIEPISIKDIKGTLTQFTVPQSYFVLNNNPALLHHLQGLL